MKKAKSRLLAHNKGKRKFNNIFGKSYYVSKKDQFSPLVAIGLSFIACFLFYLFGSLLGNGEQTQSEFIVRASEPVSETVEVEVEKIVTVETIKEVEVDRTFKTEKQQILAYLIEVFGDDADDAISMINLCENGDFRPDAVNSTNSNGTCDVGIMQINTACDSEEFEKLKDWKYNIDRGYEKFKQGDGRKYKNTFYLWTCGHVVNDYTYYDRLRGK